MSYISATVSDTTYKLISGFDGLDILGVLLLNVEDYALYIRAIFKKESGVTLQYYYVDKGQFTEELDTIFPYYYEPRPDPNLYTRVGRYTFTDTLAPINSFTAKYRKDCSGSALTLEFVIDSTDFFAIFHRSS